MLSLYITRAFVLFILNPMSWVKQSLSTQDEKLKFNMERGLAHQHIATWWDETLEPGLAS